MNFTIMDGIEWVGKIDWELRSFHGEEYSTHRGTTYNSYLVRDEKVVLIDTVWAPFGKDFVKSLSQVIDLSGIAAIVANHAEIDHSGGLPALMAEIPDVPIFCTANGLKSFKGHFHEDWNFKTVKTGDRFSLGSKELIFVEAPMLHWPDSMFCYLTGNNVLFSNDAFGQHYASDLMYNDLVNQAELYQEAIKYYANILTPFSSLVDKKIKEVVGLNLPVDMICPSHGVIWRHDPLQIVNKYVEWANAYQENQVTIIYDTMWNGTRALAEAIEEGIHQVQPETEVKLFNCARSDKNDIITQVFKSKLVLVGSPTINRGILSAIAAMLEMIKGLRFRNKKAAAFGAYGWSGESVGMITRLLQEAGLETVNEGFSALWVPDKEAKLQAVAFGKSVASM
jgi:anaerobic nitric oxide reductase flavorubredoxin